MIKYTADWTDDDIADFVAFCHEVEAEPLDVAGCWNSESGLSSTARNPRDTSRRAVAVGLFQLTAAATRDDLDAILREPIRRQLARARAYYRPHRGRLVSPGAVYLATFLPALMAHASDPDFVTCAADGPLAWAYRDNKVLDVDRDGKITVADLTAKIRAAQTGVRWSEFADRVRLACAGAPTTPEPMPRPLLVLDTLAETGNTATDHEDT